MNRIKVWPHMTIVAVVVALIAGMGVAFWMKHEQTASAEELPYAARIQTSGWRSRFQRQYREQRCKRRVDSRDSESTFLSRRSNLHA